MVAVWELACLWIWGDFGLLSRPRKYMARPLAHLHHSMQSSIAFLCRWQCHLHYSFFCPNLAALISSQICNLICQDDHSTFCCPSLRNEHCNWIFNVVFTYLYYMSSSVTYLCFFRCCTVLPPPIPSISLRWYEVQLRSLNQNSRCCGCGHWFGHG